MGKKAGEHYKTQEEINEILVTEAKDYDEVVRLKGGDPFVFGRGGEEILALQEEGISVDMIPGRLACNSPENNLLWPLCRRQDTPDSAMPTSTQPLNP